MAFGTTARGLNTTPKDRVRSAHPTATAQMGRFLLPSGARWTVRTADGTTLGTGSNAARAWDDAAARLARGGG